MAENGLKGPFELTDEVVDREVSETRPGTYTLEDSVGLGDRRVFYVGRSDTDVNNQLHVHVGSYPRFRFEYCSSAQRAFERQCALYHDFEPYDNTVHPRRSPGTQWKCPLCNLRF